MQRRPAEVVLAREVRVQEGRAIPADEGDHRRFEGRVLEDPDQSLETLGVVFPKCRRN